MEELTHPLVGEHQPPRVDGEAACVTGGRPSLRPADAEPHGPAVIAGDATGGGDCPASVKSPVVARTTSAVEGEAAGDQRSDTARAPRRAIKLVVTLIPTDETDHTWSAVVAVGAAGCDPHVKTVIVTGWREVLAAVTTLAAEAEQVWATTPRYPPAPPPAAPTRTAAAAPRRAASAVAGGEPPADPPTTVDDQTDAPVAPTTADVAPTPPAPAATARSNQLALFG